MLFCACLCSLVISSAEKSDVANGPDDHQKFPQEMKSLRAELDRLREENAALKKQNQLLQAENQQLRRLLGNTLAATNTNARAELEGFRDPAPARKAGSNQVTTAKTPLLTHWLSTSDGKRHSSHCRFYKTTPGRPCSPDEGSLCSYCGD
jgi:regulator of replication initiation timing